MMPYFREEDGSKGLLPQDSYSDILIGDKVIPVSNKEGICMLEPEVFKKKLQEKQEQAIYLQDLTELLAFAGDDMLFYYSPQIYNECKNFKMPEYKINGLLPSQLEHFPPMSEVLGTHLWAFRQIVDKHKSEVVFADGIIPKISRDKRENPVAIQGLDSAPITSA